MTCGHNSVSLQCVFALQLQPPTFSMQKIMLRAAGSPTPSHILDAQKPMQAEGDAGDAVLYTHPCIRCRPDSCLAC